MNLVVPSQGIKADHDKRTIAVPCLKMVLPYQFHEFEKVNQIEVVDDEYAYISVSVNEKPLVEPTKYIGVDLNATGHAAVVGNLETGEI